MQIKTSYRINDACHLWKCTHCQFDNMTSDEFGSEFQKSKRITCVGCKALWSVVKALPLEGATSAKIPFTIEVVAESQADPKVLEKMQHRSIQGHWAMTRSYRSLCQAHLNALKNESQESDAQAHIVRMRSAAMGILEEVGKLESALGAQI